MTNNYARSTTFLSIQTPCTHTHTHARAHTSLFHRIVPFGEGPRPGDPCPFFHLAPLFPPLACTLPGRISSSFLFLQPASSSRLFFIEFLPTTAGRRDYLWPLETIEERWKHGTRIHFRIHPPRAPSLLRGKRLGGRYKGGHQFIEADRSSRRRRGQDTTYICRGIYTVGLWAGLLSRNYVFPSSFFFPRYI